MELESLCPFAINIKQILFLKCAIFYIYILSMSSIIWLWLRAIKTKFFFRLYCVVCKLFVCQSHIRGVNQRLQLLGKSTENIFIPMTNLKVLSRRALFCCCNWMCNIIQFICHSFMKRDKKLFWSIFLFSESNVLEIGEQEGWQCVTHSMFIWIL